MGLVTTLRPTLAKKAVFFQSLINVETMKILVATEKPFAKAAVDGIREIIEGAGYELALLEKYADKADLLAAVKDADGLIIRSDKVTAEVVAAAEKLKIVVRAGADVRRAAATPRPRQPKATPRRPSRPETRSCRSWRTPQTRNRSRARTAPAAQCTSTPGASPACPAA